ncbi:hypothetical protein ABIA22_004708 [Sinorhizobium fredii]|uniref:hypothetical protein n=1 Tax=Rhizobium fredii TaxID=380 RepID=UPI003516BAED
MVAQSAVDFLRTGEWTSATVLDAIYYLLETPDNKVAAFFSEWIGLEKVLRGIPAFFVPFALAYFFFTSFLRSSGV